MASYANQKDIYSQNNTIKAPYIAINESDFYKAVRNLRPITALIWIYIIKNKSSFKLEYSPKAVSNLMGISLEQAKRAIRELAEKNYLFNICNNTWYCFAEPKENCDVLDIAGNETSMQNVSSVDTKCIENMSNLDTNNIEKHTNLHTKTSNKDADASRGANAPEPDGSEKTNKKRKKKFDEEKERRIAEKLATRNDNPDVVKATELFIDYSKKELWDLEKGLKDRTITYADLKKMGLPNNSTIYELVRIELHWRHQEEWAASFLL